MPAQQRTPAVDHCPTVIQIVGRPGTGSLPSTKSYGIDFDKRGSNLKAADCPIPAMIKINMGHCLF